jgi:hypothetical protein
LLRRTSRLCVWVVGLTLLAACGKVGNPLPPVAQIPATVDTMDVVQQGGTAILIVFPLPATSVREVSVFRRCGPPDDNPLKEILRVTAADLRALPGDRFAVSDPSPRFDVSCAYEVQFRNNHGRRSAMSNMVTTQPGPAPASPTDLTVDVKQSEIDVSWNTPSEAQGILGYYVDFREFVTRRDYVIRDFKFDVSRTVVVQSVSRVRDPMILSPPTALTFVPKDTFPPAAPADLTAVRVGEGVQLVWDAVTAPDLSGYNVYRRTEGEQDFHKIAGPIPVPRYFDAVERGSGVLYYVVTALDRSGNESGYSNQATASRKP